MNIGNDQRKTGEKDSEDTGVPRQDMRSAVGEQMPGAVSAAKRSYCYVATSRVNNILALFRFRDGRSIWGY